MSAVPYRWSTRPARRNIVDFASVWLSRCSIAAKVPSGPSASPTHIEPDVLDARVGQHPLVVPLDHQAEGRDRERQDAQDDEEAVGERVAHRRAHHRLPADRSRRARPRAARPTSWRRGAPAPRRGRRAATCASARAPPSCRSPTRMKTNASWMTSGWSAGAGGHQHGPVQRRLLAAGQAARSRSTPSTVPAKARAMPTEPIRMYFHDASTEALVTCERDQHRRRDRGRLDRDPHEARRCSVVTANSIVKANRLAKMRKRRASAPCSRRPARAPGRATPPAPPPRSRRARAAPTARRPAGDPAGPGHHDLAGQDVAPQREGRSERDEGQQRVRPADDAPVGHRDQRRAAPPSSGGPSRSPKVRHALLSASAGSAARRRCSRTSRGSGRRRSA